MRTLLVFFAACLLAAFSQDVRRVAYYSNVAQFRPVGGQFFPEDIDSTLVDYMIFHHAVVDNDCRVDFWQWNDEVLYQRFNDHKLTNPNLRTLLSVTRTNSECTLDNKDNRNTFALTGLDFCREHNFDGLDLNFDITEDDFSWSQDFTYLVQETKSLFDQDTSGPETLMLTVAVNAKKNLIDGFYDAAEITEVADWVGLKTYDFYGQSDGDRHFGMAYNHAPLYGRVDDAGDAAYVNMATITQYWIDQGADASKVLVGFGAMGVGSVLAITGCNVPGCATTGPSPMGAYTRQDGFISHYEICDMYGTFQDITYWDDQQEVVYTISVDGTNWISHDNGTSIANKANWLLDNNVGGWMMVAFDLDDFEGNFCGDGPYPVLNALNSITHPPKGKK